MLNEFTKLICAIENDNHETAENILACSDDRAKVIKKYIKQRNRDTLLSVVLKFKSTSIKKQIINICESNEDLFYIFDRNLETNRVVLSLSSDENKKKNINNNY